MTLLEKLREKLGADLMSQVEDAVGDDFDWDVVPRARLNKVIGQRNALNTKLQNLESQSAAEDDDDDNAGLDSKGGSKNVGTKGDDVEALKAQHEQELADVSKRYAVLDKLRADGAKDPKLLLSLLDLSKITLKEDESLEGYEEQITPRKESHAYLFNEPSAGAKGADDSTPGGTGKNAQSDNHDDIDPFEAVIASYTK